MMKVKYNEQGRCPLCGSYDVDYGHFEMCDEGGYYGAECCECHATWREWYNMTFGENYRVCDKDGNEYEEVEA